MLCQNLNMNATTSNKALPTKGISSINEPIPRKLSKLKMFSKKRQGPKMNSSVEIQSNGMLMLLVACAFLRLQILRKFRFRKITVTWASRKYLSNLLPVAHYIGSLLNVRKQGRSEKSICPMARRRPSQTV